MPETTNGNPTPEDSGLYTYDSFGKTNKSQSDSNFLWWCAAPIKNY